MRMAKGEKLVKKWECRDEGENSNGSTVITVTNRRVATERVCTVGTENDILTQEIMIESVKGVSYARQKSQQEGRADNGKLGSAIVKLVVAVLLMIFLKDILPEEMSIIGTIAPIVFFVWAAIDFIMYFVSKTPAISSAAYRIIIYTDATCAVGLIGDVVIGGLEAAVPQLNEFTGKMESTYVTMTVPVTFEVAKEVSETIGALLVLAQNTQA